MPKTIIIEGQEWWDEDKEEFVYLNSQRLVIEHSLASISQWESKYHKPFMAKEQKTVEETIDYIKMMTLNQVDDDIYSKLSSKHIEEIHKYMEDPMTATTMPKELFTEKRIGRKRSKVITSEQIYYWMTAQNIPFECQYWHINKLIMLIQVCAFENQPEDKKKKKLSQAELQARRAEMDARRNKYHTNG